MHDDWRALLYQTSPESDAFEAIVSERLLLMIAERDAGLASGAADAPVERDASTLDALMLNALRAMSPGASEGKN
jgi:hypothetical protein